MNKIVIIVTLIIIAGIFAGSSLLEVIGGEVDTETKVWYKKVWIGWPSWEWNLSGFLGTGDELLKEGYPTAWLPGKRSDVITLTGGFDIHETQSIGYGPYYGKYKWEVAIWDSEMSREFDDPIVIIPTSDEGGYDDDYIYDADGKLGFQRFQNSPFTQNNDPYNSCGGSKYTRWCYSSSRYTSAWPVEFSIKGSRTGYIRVRLIMDGLIWSDDVLGGYHCSLKNTEIVLLEDFAELKPGTGEVYVLPNPEAPSPDLEKYFEVGDTLKFEVSTGYDGTEGKNWRVSLHNQYGDEIERDVYDEMGNKDSFPIMLNSGTKNKEFRFLIEEGDWIEGLNNDWQIVLHNSILPYDTDVFYTLYEGGFDDVPGPTTIDWLSGNPRDTKYYSGDEVELRLTADANPDTDRPIARFEVWAYYGHQGNTEYHAFKDAVYVNDLTYTQTFGFTITGNPQDMLIIEGRAWDTTPIPGGMAMDSVIITDPDLEGLYTLTVIVQDNQGYLVEGAKVEVVDIGEKLTGSSGKAVFANIPEARYIIESSRYQLGESRDVVYLNEDTTKIVTLGMVFDLLAIAVAIIVFIVFFLIAWLVPLMPVFKIIVIIVGIVIAVVIFLFMSGVITWLG